MDQKQAASTEWQIQLDQLEQQNRQLRRALRLSEEKLAAVLEGTDTKVWQLDVASQALKIFNAPWGAMLGYPPDEIEATVNGWESCLHPDDKEEVVSAFEAHLRGESDAFEVVHRMLHKDGSNSWISDRGRVVEFDQQGKPLRMMGAHRDITQEKLYQQRLAKLIDHDPLTGLLNRAALIKNYRALSAAKSSKAALLFIDLDNFKYVNDHYGHKFGDLVLCYISDLLQSMLLANSIICRFGGDEFVILHSSAEQSQLIELAESLLAPFKAPLSVEGESIDIGLSIGISVFEVGTESFSDVCQRADQAMYQVKKSGKNNLQFCSVIT